MLGVLEHGARRRCAAGRRRGDDDVPELLDDAGEHQAPCRPVRVRRSSPSRSTRRSSARARRRRWSARQGRRTAAGRRRRRTARARGTARSGRRGRRGGRRAATVAPPSTITCRTPCRPSSSSTPPRSPWSSSARVHLRVLAARGRARRAAGRGPSTWRTVSVGSSARTVPAPTIDGVALGPQAMGVAPGGSPGDPLARAVGRRGAPVERRRQLEHDVRPARAAVLQVRRELGPHLVGRTRRLVDLDAGGAQPGDAVARDVRVGVLDADDDPRDARRDDRVGARRGPAVVRAGLERREERRPLRPVRRPPAAPRSRREDHPVARWRLRTCRPPASR